MRLLFTCCHPALAPEARITLTLRLLGGLTVAEIAQAFLVPETTMAQRMTRAKKKIAALYDQLTRLDPSPIVALNRVVAVAELDGPKVALALVDRLPLAGYHAWHGARADILRWLGQSGEAREEYDAAIAATQNSAERAYLNRKRGELL